jgi:hypothetical protein
MMLRALSKKPEDIEEPVKIGRPEEPVLGCLV